MSILIVMIPSVFFLAILIIFVLVWSIKSGQYDDVEDEKHRISFEED